MGHGCGAQGGSLLRRRTAPRVRQPPFLEGLLRLGLHMRERIAQGGLLEERSHDVFLVGVECRQPRRVSVGRTQRSHQCLGDHRRIVRTSERVVDQSGQIVAPRTGVEIAEPPEGESFEVRIGRLVLGGIERHRQVVAVHGVPSAKREGRRGRGVGSEHLERAADNGCRAHATRSREYYRRNLWPKQAVKYSPDDEAPSLRWPRACGHVPQSCEARRRPRQHRRRFQSRFVSTLPDPPAR